MTTLDDVRARVVLLFAVVALNGCVYGTAFVSAPERLSSTTLPPLTRSLRFDVCDARVGLDRAKEGTRFRKALWRAGVPAEMAPAWGMPVDFVITRGGGLEYGWSAIASAFTGTLVPGYAVQRTTLDVDLTWRDAEHVEQFEHLRYEARMSFVIWLPAILAPDVVFILADGWASPKVEDGGFRQMVERLGDDIRVRMASTPSSGNPPSGTSCTEK
jgi:hypothetical protein